VGRGKTGEGVTRKENVGQACPPYKSHIRKKASAGGEQRKTISILAVGAGIEQKSSGRGETLGDLVKGEKRKATWNLGERQ